jgi:hypothetical protein
MSFRKLEDDFHVYAKKHYKADISVRIEKVKTVADFISLQISSTTPPYCYSGVNDNNSLFLRNAEHFWNTAEFEKLDYESQFEEIKTNVKNYFETYKNAFKLIERSLRKVRKEHKERLKDFSLKCNIHPMREKYIEIKLSWTGFHDDLEIGRQTRNIPINSEDPKTESEKKIIHIFSLLNNRDRKFEKMKALGLRHDKVMENILKLTGKTFADVRKQADRTGYDWESNYPMGKKLEFEGYEFYFVCKEGHVSTIIDLSDKIRWTKGMIMLKNINVPETIRIAQKGKPVRTLIDHPLLEGANIEFFTDSQSKPGILYINTIKESIR